MMAEHKPDVDEQRRLRAVHQALVADIAVRGLTTEEAEEYRRLRAKIQAAEDAHRRHQRSVRRTAS